MAYEKIGFNKGDVLKAEHLNHIENELSLNNPSIRFSKMIVSLDFELTDEEKRAMQENPASICFSYDSSTVPTAYYQKLDNGDLKYYGMNRFSEIKLFFNSSYELTEDSYINILATRLPVEVIGNTITL